MGKTFRRGGNERGYYSPGKSLRDKRQRSGGFSRNNYDSYDESYQSNKSDNRKSKYKESFDNFDGEWA